MTCILELDVSRADTPGRYNVAVIDSPTGEASGTFDLNPSDIIDNLDILQQTLLASSVPTRALVSDKEEGVRRIGHRLFNALFAEPAVVGIYRAACAVAAERGETLRVVLRVSDSELAALPWESMFDQAAGSYVCRREPLVRYVPVASSPPPLKVQLPLRILALIASPRGRIPLDIEKEKENLTSALARQIENGSVVIEWVEHTTWTALQDTLLADSWHVVHFIGHGDFDIERDEGVLAFEDEAGHVHRVTANIFVDLLREAQPMPRLVVLNACESSATGRADLFAGTAASLVRGGVSAVAAMQFEISDDAAIAFCRGFYTAVGRGRGIDEAVRSGRVAILGLADGTLEWITPTLYLRGRDTHLFTVTASPGPGAPEPVQQERRVEASQAAHRGDVASAVPMYDSILADDPDDAEARRARESAVADSRRSPAEPEYPDRLADIWAASRRVSWVDRPWKSGLQPLAKALRPDERVIGCVGLQMRFGELSVVVVTDQFVHFSTEKPGNESWKLFVAEVPSRFRHGPNRIRVPLSDTGPAKVRGKGFAVPIDGGGSLELPVDKGVSKLIQDYLQQARGTKGP